MSDPSSPMLSAAQKSTLGDRIRNIAQQLRQEGDIQIKATSRILGAAAKLAENHDRLIDEVVDMVEEDLTPPTQVSQATAYTVEHLQQQFKTFKAAKDHFGIKARSWDALVKKLNEPVQVSQQVASPPSAPASHQAPVSMTQRLDKVERAVQAMRVELDQVLQLLETLMEKLP